MKRYERDTVCQRHRSGLLAASLVLLWSSSALAHAEEGVAVGLVSGLLHPVLGVDHLVAMVAVGLWGAQLGSPALWALPITFPMVMSAGAVLGLLGVPLPFVELGVAVSAVALGAMVAFAVRPRLPVAAALVAVFGVFHGYAHGAEVPAAANPLSYGVGFVVATGLLHLAGILIGWLVKFPVGERVVQGLGVAVAAVGAFFLCVDFGWWS